MINMIKLSNKNGYNMIFGVKKWCGVKKPVQDRVNIEPMPILLNKISKETPSLFGYILFYTFAHAKFEFGFDYSIIILVWTQINMYSWSTTLATNILQPLSVYVHLMLTAL